MVVPVVEDVEGLFHSLTHDRDGFRTHLFPQLVGFFREVGGYVGGEELSAYEALVGIAQAVSAYKVGLFVDASEAPLLRDKCWDLVEATIGLPDEYWFEPERYTKFEWSGTDVGAGLVEFDRWLGEENVEFRGSVPKRLVNVETGSDFYLALVSDEDKVPEVVERLGALGLDGALVRSV